MKIELFVIAILAGGICLTAAYATITNDNAQNSIFLDDHAIGISRTNVNGNGAGNFMTLRGYDGIIFSSAGSGAYGTGSEGMRLDSNGNIRMGNAKQIIWEDSGISITRADSTGTTVGTFLQLRGFDGIVFRTGGTGSFGTGNEAMRINAAGNLVMTGDIVGSGTGDLCFGSCP
jgi:hypothetical protein